MQALASTTTVRPVSLLRRRRTAWKLHRQPQAAAGCAPRQQHVCAKDVSRDFKVSIQAKSTKELENSIRQELLNPKHLPSSYDTAWVAMVPAQGAPQAPRFWGYVEWILQNQHSDGSWALGHLGPPPAKDAISSTLACILALKKWNVGDQHIRKGLQFIEKNSSYIMDEISDAPIGFNIIFPTMIKLGIDLGLEFPLKQSDVDRIFWLREMELQRTMNGSGSTALGRKAYMAYISEGLADILDWDEVLTYQRKNGSLFNSPSATSAFAIHSHNANALKYLDFLGNKFVSSAPMAYPLDIHSQLCLVDILENTGISDRFSCEINSILDMTYRSFQQNNEDVITDMETRAMAFRMLRMHGYDISGSDVFSCFAEESRFHDSVEGHLNDTKTLLELYKASLVRISDDEPTLENIGLWSRKLLKQQLCSNSVSRPISAHEVEYALKSPFYSAIVEPLQHKRNIECFDTTKACHAAEDILALATEDFHFSQSVYQQELEFIEGWAKEVGLGRLKFARAMPWNVFIFMASVVFPPESYDASIAWIQNSILITVVDDFFEGGGSTEELKNLVALVEKWDAHAGIGFCSEDVETLFRAVYDTNNKIAAIGAEVQNRRIVDHIAEVWVNLVRAYMVEAEWTKNRRVPTMEEYMLVAEVSIAPCAVVMPSLYLLGPELSEDMMRGPECKDLLRHLCVGARLLNDIGTYRKEKSDGCINSILLRAVGDGGSRVMSPASIETAERECRDLIADSQRELLRLVLAEGGAIPRPCRDVFWNTYKMLHRFYSDGDGFSLPEELVAAVNAVVHEPLRRSERSSEVTAE